MCTYVYVTIHMHMHIHTYIHTYTYTYMRQRIDIFACGPRIRKFICVWTNVRTHAVCMHAHTGSNAASFLCVCVFMWVCVMHTCMWNHTCTSASLGCMSVKHTHACITTPNLTCVRACVSVCMYAHTRTHTYVRSEGVVYVWGTDTATCVYIHTYIHTRIHTRRCRRLRSAGSATCAGRP